ncbi:MULTISPECIES: hypothetical protein [Flavobacteriaceae]|uniref:DUF4134 domain-containing protein n=2 Tax=Flagellimonas TaxID=444459 RepID=A0A6G7J466_9FLAO|nr:MULTISPECIES: hypothetical protein [Allomuricauda]MBW8242884.1 hypothetical protein [Allomuricauda oceani]QII45389.1 hypothetical protein GVT53_12085 [Allomuricauda oceani]TXJ91986.1 hypothetical protein FQ017_14190 [Allomuricauda maritima]GMN08045.1 hypothetical protein MTsPCn5_34340 [Croceitalea sp. MTPC5]
MKNSRLSKTPSPLRNRSWTTPINVFLTLFLIVAFHSAGFAQIDELVDQVNEAEQGTAQIGNSIFRIIKIAAGVLLAIAALAFLIIREQNQDMARKVGNAIVGLVIFYGLIEIGENLAN